MGHEKIMVQSNQKPRNVEVIMWPGIVPRWRRVLPLFYFYFYFFEVTPIYVSFLLLSLSLNCSSFSHCLGCNLRLLVLDLPSFLIYTFNAKHSKCCFHCILQVLVDCIFIFIEFKILFNFFLDFFEEVLF